MSLADTPVTTGTVGKRKKRKDETTNRIMDYLEKRRTEAVNKTNLPEPEDEDRSFLLSLLPGIKALPDHQKSSLRLRFQQTLHDMRFGNDMQGGGNFAMGSIHSNSNQNYAPSNGASNFAAPNSTQNSSLFNPNIMYDMDGQSYTNLN